MGATRKYVVIDPATGKIDRRIFSDQAIYDEEMEQDLRPRLADDRAREPGARGPTTSSTPTWARTRSS